MAMTARPRWCGPTSSISRSWNFSIAAGSTRTSRASATATRETAYSFYLPLDADGTTEMVGRQFHWRTNDVFVIPNVLWRRHINRSSRDAVLYLSSDRPLFEKVGQYRAQGRTPDGEVAPPQ